MTATHQHEESDEIYHRIYRLIKRRLSAQTIAATLHLPLRTVLGVINRLERTESPSPPIKTDSSASSSEKHDEPLNDTDFLDVYFYPKTRYAVIDLVGALSDSHVSLLETELQKAQISPLKAVALRMSDVHLLSEAAARTILSSKETYAGLGRYLALLDPSPAIEQSLINYSIESQIPIFGTERAFEEAAFLKKAKTFSRHNQQSSAGGRHPSTK